MRTVRCTWCRSNTDWDRAALLDLLREASIGAVSRIEPIRRGLSGAAVYAVTASRGNYVLKVQNCRCEEGDFDAQLRVMKRAADAGIAPALAHVDPSARAVVSERVVGKPLASVLRDPMQRGSVIASVVECLSALHALDSGGVPVSDLLPRTWEAWEATHKRPGFPNWGASLPETVETMAATLALDRRPRVVSHNDVNPGNLIWDGARAWLIDWEVSGVGHPYYDLASFALFTGLNDEMALGLAARHDKMRLDEHSRASFRALRKLAGVLSGLTFLGLVDDLYIRTAKTLAEAPQLTECYEGLRVGKLDVQSPYGQASMGLALLALGLRCTA